MNRGNSGEQQLDPTTERYHSFAYMRLQNNSEPQDVYRELLEAGLDQKRAGTILSSVISKLIEEGLFDPMYFEEMSQNMPKEEEESPEQPQGSMSEQEEADYEDSYAADPSFQDNLDSGVSEEETQGMVGQMEEGGSTGGEEDMLRSFASNIGFYKDKANEKLFNEFDEYKKKEIEKDNKEYPDQSERLKSMIESFATQSAMRDLHSKLTDDASANPEKIFWRRIYT